MRNILSLMFVALIAIPVMAPADKRDDQLLEIQRDVADVGEKVNNLQKAQAAQTKDLQDLRALVQQAASAATQASQDMAALKTALSGELAEQQNKISQAVSGPLGSRIDGLSTTIDQLNTSFGAVNDRLSKLDKRVSDLNDKISTLNQPPPAPPTPANAPDNGAANGVPPGVTPTSLQSDAQRDYLSNKDDLALKEFSDYVKYWPMDSYSPTAGYMIGLIYLNRVKDYDSAVDAFQAVIDHYPSNNQSQDALYQKARALEAGGHKKEALEAFRSFVDKYPVNDNVPAAQREIQKLSGAGRGRGGAAKK